LQVKISWVACHGVGSSAPCSRETPDLNPPSATRRPSSARPSHCPPMRILRRRISKSPSTTSCTHGRMAVPTGSTSPRSRSSTTTTGKPPLAERASAPSQAAGRASPAEPVCPPQRRRGVIFEASLCLNCFESKNSSRAIALSRPSRASAARRHCFPCSLQCSEPRSLRCLLQGNEVCAATRRARSRPGAIPPLLPSLFPPSVPLPQKG
jgi:hypothetical protein